MVILMLLLLGLLIIEPILALWPWENIVKEFLIRVFPITLRGDSYPVGGGVASGVFFEWW